MGRQFFSRSKIRLEKILRSISKERGSKPIFGYYLSSVNVRVLLLSICSRRLFWRFVLGTTVTILVSLPMHHSSIKIARTQFLLQTWTKLAVKRLSLHSSVNSLCFFKLFLKIEVSLFDRSYCLLIGKAYFNWKIKNSTLYQYKWYLPPK